MMWSILGDPNSAQAKEEKVMKSPAVTTIKEMGYSEDKIKAAIHTIKSRLPRGRTYIKEISKYDIHGVGLLNMNIDIEADQR